MAGSSSSSRGSSSSSRGSSSSSRGSSSSSRSGASSVPAPVKSSPARSSPPVKSSPPVRSAPAPAQHAPTLHAPSHHAPPHSQHTPAPHRTPTKTQAPARAKRPTTQNPPAQANKPTQNPPAHAPSTAQSPAQQQQQNSGGSFMRGAMTGLATGMLATVGMNTLFGNRNHDNTGEVAAPDAQGTQAVQAIPEVVEENRGLDGSDLVASLGGAGSALAVATVLKNRKSLYGGGNSTAVALRNTNVATKSPFTTAAIRAPFQLPRRYMVISILGAMGGLLLNAVRKESATTISEPAPIYDAYSQGYDPHKTNKWGDEIEEGPTA